MSDVTRYSWIDLTVHARFIELFVGKISMLRETVSNVKNAFAVKHPERIIGKHVVLIDDVMTTGSTLKECASEIRKAGAASVDTLTVARVC